MLLHLQPFLTGKHQQAFTPANFYLKIISIDNDTSDVYSQYQKQTNTKANQKQSKANLNMNYNSNLKEDT
jgi:hypothetical protein